jgi:hypothetical protein
MAAENSRKRIYGSCCLIASTGVIQVNECLRLAQNIGIMLSQVRLKGAHLVGILSSEHDWALLSQAPLTAKTT